jgi:glycine/D-amino acid oxidase-like deaminating enzyme
MIVTEPAAPLVEHLLAHANRHLTLKQAVNGNLIIGGGWTAALDPVSLRPRVKRDSLEGNLWAAERVLPAVGSINVIRSWAAMNVVIDGAPILGEAPGHPGFFNAVTVNGLTMGPLIGLLNAEIIRTGRCSRNIAPYTLSRF